MAHNITVFYHVWQAPGWQLLFQQQIMSMCVSGLYDAANTIYVCCNGEESLPFDNTKLVIKRNTHLEMEADTLYQMWQYCNIVPDQKILYIHTKGLSYGYSLTRPTVDAWRLYLERYVIHDWKSCVTMLHDHDVVGTEWMDGPAIYIGPNKQIYAAKNSGIFVGNFWWANSGYIKKLDPTFLYNYDAAHKIENIEIPKEIAIIDTQKQILRFNSELWLGTKDPKVHSFNRLHARFYDTNIMSRLEEFL
jgi:hypothetical protein